MTPNPINLMEVDFYTQDPHPAFKWLREADPVHRHADPEFYAIMRYADVLAVLRDHSAYSSAGGTDLVDMPDNFVRSILNMDPPRHTMLRQVLNREFSSDRLRSIEPVVRSVTNDVLDSLDDGEVLDFASRVADAIPMRVLGQLIGIPPADDQQFKAWNLAMINAPEPFGHEVTAITEEMVKYFRVLRARRLQEPADDIVTRLAHAEIDGVQLTDLEYFGNLRTLMTGGQDTTSNLISAGVLEFHRHPEAWYSFRESCAPIDTTVDEVARYTLGVTHLVRRSTRNTVLGDTPIPAGSKVALFFISANRDETVFDQPDRFDILRDPNPHLTFGFGRHHCIGRGLALLEAKVAFEAMRERFSRIEVSEPVRRLNSRIFPGIVEMHATVHR